MGRNTLAENKILIKQEENVPIDLMNHNCISIIEREREDAKSVTRMFKRKRKEKQANSIVP